MAGSSAGAIAAALIAAIAKKGEPDGMQALHGYLDNLTFTEFMPQGKLHAFLDHHFGQAGELLSDADVLDPPDGRLPGRLPLHLVGTDHEHDARCQAPSRT